MNSKPYTVHIYEEEAEFISKWTLDYPNRETGGDFFGLWLNETEVVIQAVLGPGQNCRRTATSFFQNEAYLSKVGGLLTRDEGLCNIGSWHSHHSMNLPEPSRGDQDTVWRHLPTPGRFLLLIANIKMSRDGPKVQMSFCLFESSDKGKKLTNMNCSILKGRSPIRANKAVMDEVANGAEVYSNSTSYQERSVQSSVTEVNNDIAIRGTKAGSPEMCVQRGHGKQDVKGSPRNIEQKNSNHLQEGSDRRRRKDRRPQQNRMCDGLGTYYPHASWKLKAVYSSGDGYELNVYVLPDGSERVKLYHDGHSTGRCEACRNVVLELCTVEHQNDQDCCCIII